MEKTEMLVKKIGKAFLLLFLRILDILVTWNSKNFYINKSIQNKLNDYGL